MTYYGHVKNGEIALGTPIPLPEGAEIRVEIILSNHNGPSSRSDTLKDLLLRHAGKGNDLPSDLASRHDFYAHGKPVS